MENLNRKQILALLTLAACIATLIFGFMLITDGEEMFVIGTVISSAILLLCVDGLLAAEFFEIANFKGYDDQKYFWYAFLFGIPGFLLIMAIPTKNN